MRAFIDAGMMLKDIPIILNWPCFVFPSPSAKEIISQIALESKLLATTIILLYKTSLFIPPNFWVITEKLNHMSKDIYLFLFIQDQVR